MEIQDRISKVEIDAELLKRFEDLPDSRRGGAYIEWTPQMDELLKRFWKIKKHDQVVALLGVSIPTASNRYDFLMEENNE